MALSRGLCKHGTYPVGAHSCPECDQARWRADGSQRRERDKAAGGSIYSTVEWGRVRRQILRRDKFRCQYGGPGCLVKANVAAHREPPSGRDDPLAYDPQNLIASCAHCNRGEQEHRLRALRAVDL